MIYGKVVFTLLIALASTGFGYEANVLNPAAKALLKFEDYDSTVRPPGDQLADAPVNVTVNLYVINIDDINFIDDSFSLHMYFREEWVDSRISFQGPEQIVTNDLKPFWKPDLFFIHEKCGHVHSLQKQNTLVRVHANGKILISSRMTLRLRCPLNLWKFPFDNQRCQLQMESYGYTTKDVNINWRINNPLQVSNELKVPGFTLKGIETTESSEGDYKILQAFFQFKRHYSTYVVRVFIPMALLVIASWSTFWLPASNVVARFSVGSITSLSATLLVSREEFIMHMPVLTSLDLWVGGSVFFIFAAFFEYIFVIYKESQNAQKGIIKKCEAGKSGKLLGIKMDPNANCADNISKIVFSVSYVLFNIIYVCTLI